MAREFRARFSKGKIEPLEEVDLREGEEFTVTIKEEAGTDAVRETLARTAGAWKGTLDFDAYLKDLYASHPQPLRCEPLRYLPGTAWIIKCPLYNAG